MPETIEFLKWLKTKLQEGQKIEQTLYFPKPQKKENSRSKSLRKMQEEALLDAMDGKFIQVDLNDGRNIYIDGETWGKCQVKGLDTNTDDARRSFKVLKVGENKMELNLQDNRNLYITKDSWISAEPRNTCTNTSDMRRTFILRPQGGMIFELEIGDDGRNIYITNAGWISAELRNTYSNTREERRRFKITILDD